MKDGRGDKNVRETGKEIKEHRRHDEENECKEGGHGHGDSVNEKGRRTRCGREGEVKKEHVERAW